VHPSDGTPKPDPPNRFRLSWRIGSVLKVGGATGAATVFVVLLLFVVAPDLLFGGASTSATDKFLRMKTSEKILANQILDGDTVCLLPAGIPPMAVLGDHQKTAEGGFYWDSDAKWYVLILRRDSDVGKIMHVDRSKVDLAFEHPICSTNLVIVADNRNGRRLISADHGGRTH
jgi:hypothetical protein